jgi:hypothetical protein
MDEAYQARCWLDASIQLLKLSGWLTDIHLIVLFCTYGCGTNISSHQILHNEWTNNKF